MRSWVVLLLAGLVLTGTPLLAPAGVAATRPCASGLVALTFDDGPDRRETPRLLDILDKGHVKATFFLVGQRVAARPRLARAIHERGHVVANHTWSHPQLTRLGDGRIRDQLGGTRTALNRARSHPSRLMRPPYGAIDGRVRGVIRGMGLVPVLWDIDTRDWTGGTARQIADRVLAGLRPHRSNIVLQHDGVKRSAASVSAVERIVRQGRARGYCFTTLGRDGRPEVPVPVLSARVTSGAESPRRPVTVRLRLDRPTTRAVSVLLATSNLSAKAGADYVDTTRRVRFPAGSRERTIRIGVLDDVLVESVERVRITLRQAKGLRVSRVYLAGDIHSEDTVPMPPPWSTPAPAPTSTATSTPTPSPAP